MVKWLEYVLTSGLSHDQNYDLFAWMIANQYLVHDDGDTHYRFQVSFIAINVLKLKLPTEKKLDPVDSSSFRKNSVQIVEDEKIEKRNQRKRANTPRTKSEDSPSPSSSSSVSLESPQTTKMATTQSDL